MLQAQSLIKLLAKKTKRGNPLVLNGSPTVTTVGKLHPGQTEF